MVGVALLVAGLVTLLMVGIMSLVAFEPSIFPRYIGVAYVGITLIILGSLKTIIGLVLKPKP